MDVLSSVLCKVHTAVRASGAVLITQPATADEIIELEIDGERARCEVLERPNFALYLKATHPAINSAVERGLFRVEDEATTPADGTYHCQVYDSVDAWIQDQNPTCGDAESLNAMEELLRNIARGRQHRVLSSWRDYAILLRKP